MSTRDFTPADLATGDMLYMYDGTTHPVEHEDSERRNRYSAYVKTSTPNNSARGWGYDLAAWSHVREVRRWHPEKPNAFHYCLAYRTKPDALTLVWH